MMTENRNKQQWWWHNDQDVEVYNKKQHGAFHVFISVYLMVHDGSNHRGFGYG